MITLNIPIPGNEYDILIENGLLDKTGEKCRDLLHHDAKVFIITDVNVAPLYAKRLADILTSAGIINHTIIMPLQINGQTIQTTITTIPARVYTLSAQTISAYKARTQS